MNSTIQSDEQFDSLTSRRGWGRRDIVGLMSESGSRIIVEKAETLGFDRVGIVPAGAPTHLQYYDEWLNRGLHGEMGYLERNRELRADPRLLHVGTISLVTVALSYCPSRDEGCPSGVASYARGVDYHKLMRRRLAKLGRFIDAELGPESVKPRAFVDSAPVLERDIAATAGLGWFGKSANIINSDLGSYLFLGELFVARELAPIISEQPDRCGRCTACIDSCPTGAITEPFRVDARRCISYLTIEKRGAIPLELRPLVGGQLFGCDLCQTVCPWNRKAPVTTELSFRTRGELLRLNPTELLGMDEVGFQTRFQGSPLRRAGRAGLARNSAVVMGNSGDRGHVPALIAAVREDPDPLVRGHAAWALGRLGSPAAQEALKLAMARESDPGARQEIELAREQNGV